MSSVRRKLATKIPWKYCECGCHCHTVTVAGTEFSLFNDLKGGLFLAQGQHHARLYGKRYASWKAANAMVRRVLRRMRSELDGAL